MVVMPTSAGTLRTMLLHPVGRRMVQASTRRRHAAMAETEIAEMASRAESGSVTGILIEDPMPTGDVMLAGPDSQLVARGLRTCAEYLRSNDLPPPGTRVELLVGQAP
jgi:hypothetical protein